MTCRDFQDVVVELARERELAGKQDAAALAHAGSCEDCGRRLADQRALSAGLAAIALDARHHGAPQRVEDRLLKAVGRSGANQRRRTRRYVFGAGAIAAALLIAAWLSFSGAGSVRRKEAPGTGIVSVRAPEIRAAKTDDKRRSSVPRVMRVRRLRRPARQGQTPNEIATDFIPIPFADPLDANEEAAVVRVQLPRSSLLAMGLPMNENRASERIRADVVLGQDGIARAIRFVR